MYPTDSDIAAAAERTSDGVKGQMLHRLIRVAEAVELRVKAGNQEAAKLENQYLLGLIEGAQMMGISNAEIDDRVEPALIFYCQQEATA